jgi:predicted transcriptional regulator
MANYHLKLEAPWAEVKERIKEVYAEITDADLVYEPGQEKELLKKLSKKMNKDIESVKAWIESISFTDGIAS